MRRRAAPLGLDKLNSSKEKTMQRMKFVVPVALGVLLAACGGGGGGSGGGGSGTAAPAALTLSASAAKVRVGEAVTLTWNASNVTSCQGADAWSGSQAASGSTSITPTAGGKFTYTLNCTGASGTVSQSVQVTQACLHPRKASIADFNGDGQPDVFFACHGFDASPFPGERPHVLLSQASGKYKNVTLPQACFCHSASAADLNGDGKPDVVVTDTSVALKPYVLINDGNGETFTQDFGRLPASLNGGGMVYSLELIDTGSGKPDLFFGVGTPPGSGPANPSPSGAVPNGVLKNDGDGRFLTAAIQALPNPPGSSGITYGLALDFMVVNGYVYYPQINNAWDASNPFYANTIVHKARLSDMSVTTLYEHFGAYNNGITWFPWLAVGTDGKMNVACDQYVYDPATLPGSSCGVSFPL